MSIEHAERLKKELTDQWVVVATGVPELRRFQNFTGQVKTVNMNCRALVEFKGSEDIGWYDIDPQFLTVVDAPSETDKHTAETTTTEKPAAKDHKPASKAPVQSGGSPLDKIRAQGSGAAAAPAKSPAGGSPLDKIRAQAGGAPAAKAAPAKPAGVSPLDQIRAQSGGAAAAPAPAVKKPAPAKDPVAAKEPAADKKPAAQKTAPANTSGMSPLDLIRAQGGFKGEK